MRRTIRGRGARGFIEPMPPDLPAFVELLRGGGAIVHSGNWRGAMLQARLNLVDEMMRAGLFAGKPSPLLSMRGPRA